MQDLTKLPLVGCARARAFTDMGITTIRQVAKIDPFDAAFQRYSCFSAGYLDLIRNYADAIVQNRVIVKAKHPFFESRKKMCFFDSEYSPTGTRTGPYGIFLIGIMDENGKVTQYFLDDPSDEEEMLNQFRDWLVREEPVLVSYSSTSADRPQLMNAFGRFGIPIHELDSAFFDLYYHCINTQRTATQFVFLPVQGSLSSKNVAVRLGYKAPRDLGIIDGLQALITYGDYLESKRERLKLDLLEYNKTDLEMTKYIFDKIDESMKLADGDSTPKNIGPMFGVRGIPARSDDFEDYKCPRCGHFHSSKFMKKRLPIKCLRCRYDFSERDAHP